MRWCDRHITNQIEFGGYFEDSVEGQALVFESVAVLCIKLPD